MSFAEFVISTDIPPSPCRKCKERRVGCHDTGACRAYDEYRQITEARYKAHASEYEINHYVDERIRLSIKKGRRRNV